MTRRIASGICLSVLLLAGCGAESTSTEPPETLAPEGITEVRHKLLDGRTVTCLLWDEGPGYDSGMSCDWANAK